MAPDDRRPWRHVLDGEALDLLWLEQADGDQTGLKKFQPGAKLFQTGLTAADRPGPELDEPVRYGGVRRTVKRSLEQPPAPPPPSTKLAAVAIVPAWSPCCPGALLTAPLGRPHALSYGVQVCGLCGRDVARRNPRSGRFELLNGEAFDSPLDAP